MSTELRVLKFVLRPGENVIEAAALGRPLAIGWQGTDLVLWIEATPGTGQRRSFLSVATGEYVPPDGVYVGSAQTDVFGSRLVFHVYAEPVR